MVPDNKFQGSLSFVGETGAGSKPVRPVSDRAKTPRYAMLVVEFRSAPNPLTDRLYCSATGDTIEMNRSFNSLTEL